MADKGVLADLLQPLNVYLRGIVDLAGQEANPVMPDKLHKLQTLNQIS